jgi:hypothetical protein
MGHGDYERLTPEAIGPAVVRLRAGDGGEADRAGAGSVYEHGARLPAPVRRCAITCTGAAGSARIRGCGGRAG